MGESNNRWGKTLRRAGLAVGFVAVFGAGILVQGWFSGPTSPVEQPSHGDHSGSAAAKEKEPSFWTCAMHPQIRLPRPGKCPICAMELVPVTSSAGGIRQITLSPETVKLMALETSPVERKFVTAEVRMVGKVAYDETRLGYITAWVAGRLDRLYVDYTGVSVKKGDHMVYIYSPELYTAQTELIQALQFPKTPGQVVDLAASARERLRLLGMIPDQIKDIEKSKKATDHMTIFAPSAGIVIQKRFSEGDYVKVGDRIYAIADLSQVWVLLDAYESDLSWIRYGQEVTFTTEAYPGETFVGRISFLDPVLNDKTRTVKVRVNVPNATGKLKPDMFVSGVVRARVAGAGRVMDPSLAGKWISPMHPEIVRDESGKCPVCGMPLVRAEELGYVTAVLDKEAPPLVIPRSAALVTGTRAIVYVQLPGQEKPTYEGREIVLGPRAGDYYLVRYGLKEGDIVVTNGNFKLDSALQIQAKPSMMTPDGGGGGGHDHGGQGATDKKKETPGMEKMKVPAEFHLHLKMLEGAYQKVARAVETDKLDEIRGAFFEFGKVMDGMNGKVLKDHPLMLWNDLAMLLRNDVVEGKDVKQSADAKRVFGLLTEHMRRVREQFGATHGGHEPAAALVVPEPFQKQLATVFDPYLALQKGLAGDNLKQSQEAVGRIRATISTIDTKMLPEVSLAAWKKEQTQFLQIMERLEKAKDLTGLRAEFSPLSAEMAVLVRQFGIGASGPVYQLNCSMAFGGRGASWLQGDSQPLNPYFGSAMLRCADRVETLVAPKEGHRHE